MYRLSWQTRFHRNRYLRRATMLTITIPETEYYDEEKSRFIVFKGATISLEHSLLSLSKWESKWHIHFIENKTITNEQLLDYIKCMTLTQNVDPLAYYCLTPENIEQIRDYIKDPMTATTFSNVKTSKPGAMNYSGRYVTSELIYYWMTASQIPWEAQKWHLNRLLTLIRVCSEENDPDKHKKKKPQAEVLKENAAINAARRAKSGSKG